MLQRSYGKINRALRHVGRDRLILVVLGFSSFFFCAGLADGQIAASVRNSGRFGESSSSTKSIETKHETVSETTVVRKTTGEKIKRWLEFDTFSLSTRYRFIENSNRRTASNANQYQVALRGKFKFDKKGDYSVIAGLYSGNNFTSGWNNTGWGTGDTQTNLYLKQLYFQARPVKGVEIQYGGLTIARGQSTEVTSYDNDAYIMGERLSLKIPKKLFFDDISVTYAYLGDLNKPNVFNRFRRLNKSNYHQFLVGKHIGKRADFSADYTFESGTDTLHQAIKLKVPETKLLDTVLFENYQRVSGNKGYGFNLFGEKKVSKKFSLNGGFAHLDRRTLQGDRFPAGNSVYSTAAFKLNNELTLSTFIIRGLGSAVDVRPRTRFEFIVGYNVLDLLRRKKLQ